MYIELSRSPKDLRIIPHALFDNLICGLTVVQLAHFNFGLRLRTWDLFVG
ncbi:MAG: hypothetical protein RL518_1083, partial [Pseudomonadota bacterium]